MGMMGCFTEVDDDSIVFIQYWLQKRMIYLFMVIIKKYFIIRGLSASLVIWLNLIFIVNEMILVSMIFILFLFLLIKVFLINMGIGVIGIFRWRPELYEDY